MSNHPRQLVALYTAFYKADKQYRPSARKCIQPLYEACDIICRADSSVLQSPEYLADAIAGRISKFMQQIHAGNGSLGRWVLGNRAEERQAILAFASYLVNDVFYGSFNGDLARFAGKQRGYLEDTCEFLYRIELDAENQSSV